MSREEFIQMFERENGYVPDDETIDLYMQHYCRFNQESRQQGRVYQFTSSASNSESDYGTNELLKEIKNIFCGIAKCSKKSSGKIDDDNMSEFGFMAAIFLFKAGLYFLLKTAYSKGFDFANL